MDGELVSDLPSDGEGEQPFLHTYTEQFYDQFPYYLSIGMTCKQYWDGDATLPIYYRKADEMRNERRNQELWLQGMYVYEAICDASPILHSFAKKGTKPRRYAEAPYPITEKKTREDKVKKAKRERDKGLRYMEDRMLTFNKKFGVERK